jgi:cell division protein FtsW
VADRTIARGRPRSSTAEPYLRLVRADEVLRPTAAAAAVARRNLTLLLVPTALLTVVGLVMILSAGSISAVEGYGTSFWYFNRQTLYAVAGVIGLVVTARVPYSFWRRAAIPMLLGLLPLMLLALHPSIGSSLYGASRWIDLGPITLQPAEFAKLLTICSAAAILSRPWKDLSRARDAFIPLGPLVLVVAGLVLLQRDLGTMLIICGSVFLLLFVAGIRLRYLVWTAMGATGAIAYFIFGERYRRTRFLDAWLRWELDPSGAGWQLRQGLIALGSGGWFGVGLGNSRQKWDYLPNAHSDFVRIAMHARDPFGRLLAAGITGWIGLQTLMNLGAVTGLLPITGVPLPFLSFGGTALVVTLAGVGVMVSVALDGARSTERRHVRSRSTGGRARP